MISDYISKSKDQLIKDLTKTIEKLKKLKKSEEELNSLKNAISESEKTFSSIIESSPMGMHMYSIESGDRLVFIGSNPAADLLLGVDNKQFIGKTLEEAFPPLADTDIPEIYRKAALEGIQWKTEQVDYKDDKISGAFEVHAFQTMPGKMVAMFLDITERKQAEHELMQSEERFKRLFESLGDAVYVTKVGGTEIGRILEVNYTAVQQTGYSKEELLNMNIITDLTVAGSGEMETENWDKLLQEGKTVKSIEKKKRKDGTEFWTEVIVSPFEFKGENACLSINHNITDRKEAEKQLFEKTNFINKIIDSSALSTWISDENGTAIMVNPACLDFFGAKEEEIVGKYNLFQDEVIKANGFLPEIERVFKNAVVANIVIDYSFREVSHVSVDHATHKVINSIFTPILNEDGKVVNVIVQTIDLTEMKKAEKEIKKHRDHLEEMVRERTKELEARNHDLERFNKLFVDREFRIKELRDKVKDLENQLRK